VENDGGRQFQSVFPYNVYGAELIKLLQHEGHYMSPSTAQAANQSTSRNVLFLK